LAPENARRMVSVATPLNAYSPRPTVAVLAALPAVLFWRKVVTGATMRKRTAQIQVKSVVVRLGAAMICNVATKVSVKYPKKNQLVA